MHLKVSKRAIEQFKLICRNEQDSSDELVTYKLTRDFILGKYIRTTYDGSFIVGFGTLRIMHLDGKIIDVCRGKKKYKAQCGWD